MKPLSFYFFDFDENILFLNTTSFLYHKDHDHEVELTSRQYSNHYYDIGQRGPYQNYEVRKHSFRNFSDHNDEPHQFLKDMSELVSLQHKEWQGPSWQFFEHAVAQARPLSLITARGHRPETLRQGISLLVQNRHLQREPNYHTIYPVIHPDTASQLVSQEHFENVPVLKARAFRESVLQGLEIYGEHLEHRFGMSDDNRDNLDAIEQEMRVMKKQFRHLRFYLIATCDGKFTRTEVL